MWENLEEVRVSEKKGLNKGLIKEEKREGGRERTKRRGQVN